MIHEVVVSSLLLYLMRGRGNCKGRALFCENAGSENAKWMDRSDSCSCASVGAGLVGGFCSGTFFYALCSWIRICIIFIFWFPGERVLGYLSLLL